ncbi:MAG: DUF455 family protein, partial [Oxalobacteraceae bacterium]
MNPPFQPDISPQPAVPELRAAALFWLCEPDPANKVAGVTALAQAWQAGVIALDAQATLTMLSTLTTLTTERTIPGQPARPELVAPRDVKRRTMQTPEGRATLIHALAHIEFNAINLALDAIWRFADMPVAYYADWLQVAAEEALHFSLLAGHLRT